MGRKIYVPLSICDKGYFEGHLLGLILNALDENAFTSVLNHVQRKMWLDFANI